MDLSHQNESPHLQLHVTLVCEEGSMVLIERRGSSLPYTHTQNIPPTLKGFSSGLLAEGAGEGFIHVCVWWRGWSSWGGQLQDHTQENHPAHGLPCASPGLSVMPPPSFTCVFYSPSDLTRAVIILPAGL